MGLHLLCIGSGDIKEPIYFSQRVGNIALGVVMWPCYC